MHDVLVAGGGLTGASLAVALAGQGLKVAVVETVAPEDPGQPSLDDRTSAIARTGVRILRQLDVWTRLSEAPSPIRAVEISERGCFGAARIEAAAEGLDTLGSVVRNRVLGQALWEKLRELENVDIFCPARVRSVENGPRSVVASIESGGAETARTGTASAGTDENGKASSGKRDGGKANAGTGEGSKANAGKGRGGKAGTLRARLLAVAEGARSPLRDAFGIATRQTDYAQVAITGLVQVRKVVRPDTAWERFTSEGPLALIPAGGTRYGFVIVARRDEAARIADMEETALLAHLQALVGYRAGEFVRAGRRATYPLALSRAAEVTAPRAVLVGAAANSVHPLAAQGFNLALRDVAALTETLARIRERGLPALENQARPPADPGAPELLSRYASWRSRDQANVVRFTDALARLSRNPLLRPLRGLALQAFDLAPEAKPLLARFALGQGGRMTRLARGLPL